MNKTMVVIVLACLLTPPTLFGQNLIPNPGFESGDEKIALSHGVESRVKAWAAYYFPGKNCVAEWQKGEAHGGEYCVRFNISEPALARTVSWTSAMVPVAPDERYAFSAWIRLKGVKAGTTWHKPGIIAVFFDRNRKRIKHGGDVRIGKADTPWQKLSGSITVPKGAAFMALYLVVSQCTGTVWFDDVELVRIRAASALVAGDAASVPRHIIMPQPRRMSCGKRAYPVENLHILADPAFRAHANFPQVVSEMTKLVKHPVLSGDWDGQVPPHVFPLVFASAAAYGSAKVWQSRLGDQGYYLRCGNISKKQDGIVIAANSLQGIYYGCQTLKQLLDVNTMRMPEVEIADWPSFAVRGTPGGPLSSWKLERLAAFKMNFYYLAYGTFGKREWLRPLRDSEVKYLTGIIARSRKRFVTVTAPYNPGWGRTEIHFSDPEQLRAILARYRSYYACGVRHFTLAFDDLFNIGRDKLTFADDLERFGDIGHAHAWLAGRVWEFLQKLDSGNKLYVIPMYYYDPRAWSAAELAYNRALAGLPREIYFINCACYTREMVDVFERIMKRRPFIWTNYFGQYDRPAGVPMPSIVPPLSFAFSHDIAGYAHGFIFLMPGNQDMLWSLAADFAWNVDRYNPEKSAALCVRKIVGSGNLALITAASGYLQSIAGFPLSGSNRDEWLMSGRATIKALGQWKRKLEKSLPEAQYIPLANELREKEEFYRAILQDLAKRPYPIKVLPMSRPVIDGVVGDKEWPAPGCSNFLMLRRFWEGRGRRPKAGTVVFFGYDRENLYVAFRCSEPAPAKIRRRVTAHDGMVFTDDCCELFLQPFADKDYFHIVVNSLGTIYDAKGRGKVWDSNIQSRARIGDGMWEVEMLIPFKHLGKFPQQGERWRFNVARERYAGSKEISSWCLLRRGFHEPERFWHLRFE